MSFIFLIIFFLTIGVEKRNLNSIVHVRSIKMSYLKKFYFLALTLGALSLGANTSWASAAVEAEYGMAIKLTVSDKGQDGLYNNFIQTSEGKFSKTNKGNLHLTIGYIDRVTQRDLSLIQQLLSQAIKPQLAFEVAKAFGLNTRNGLMVMLEPTNKAEFQGLNQLVQKALLGWKSPTTGRTYQLNQLTQPGSFLPHLSLGVAKDPADATLVTAIDDAIGANKSSFGSAYKVRMENALSFSTVKK